MNLDDVAMFVRVVEAGGYAAAARARGMPKSSLSRRVSKLETVLGVQLLSRNTRHLRLTEAGALLYERCRAMVVEADALEADLAASNAGARSPKPDLQGLLRVTATGAFGRLYVAPLVGEFLCSHPGIRIDLSVLERRVNLIEEGFDVALRMGVLDDAVGLTARRLGAAARLLCASPAYLARHGEKPTLPAELRQHSVLISAVGQNGWSFENSDGAEEAFSPMPTQVRLIANNLEVLHAAALAGVGVAILPQYMVQGDLEAGRLVGLMRRYVVQPTNVSAVWPGGRFMQPKTRAFVDFIATRLSGEEAWLVSPHDLCMRRLHVG